MSWTTRVLGGKLARENYLTGTHNLLCFESVAEAVPGDCVGASTCSGVASALSQP